MTFKKVFIPDLIGIWHFGVWKYGPHSSPVLHWLEGEQEVLATPQGTILIIIML